MLRPIRPYPLMAMLTISATPYLCCAERAPALFGPQDLPILYPSHFVVLLHERPEKYDEAD